MNVKMVNPNTGEVKEVKVGWSWILFLFSGFLGLPLFLRKLYVWGGVFFALWVLLLIIPSLMPNQDDELVMIVLINLIFLGLQVWMGIKGNEMTAKNYLDNGWSFSSEDEDSVKFAKENGE